MSHADNRASEHETRWTAVDSYSFACLHPSSSATPSNEALQRVISNSRTNDLADIAVSPSQGKFLMLQTRMLRAKHVLEVGTLGAYSAIWLANAGPDVRVTTVEIDEKHARVSRENLEAAGVGERVEILLGSGLEVLPRLRKEVEEGRRERYGFVFIDADKQNNWSYFDESVKMCVPGACIVVDNVVRKGQLADEEAAESDPKVKGSQTVVKNVGKDERVDGIVMQTVGEKGYDGFLIAVVNGN
ncbi:hypothetical protein W97_08648 [Coniosporium apollinis CBS 100218]|uniref:O-methyltransferase n=1 Tax=Coniosporium apollinis (strain CBS 100218) TaxID=1168221 RepID=R7Z5K3_CONA1|nr:uncharacterized protein W97_08648 [Coniosporium apollinis CBS 100218]EON69388.1 hypothetical protein W97_08648 [Coniosporium apollinis CBS 100218]